jgi:hypothetical protein
MYLTKDQNLRVSGSDETNHLRGRKVSWGRCPQTPGIYRFDANPS